MEILLFIFLGASIIWCFIASFRNNKNNPTLSFSVSLTLVAVASYVMGMYVSNQERLKTEPTAIDVYKGNTSLMITYKDSAVLDSTVVFKDFE